MYPRIPWLGPRFDYVKPVNVVVHYIFVLLIIYLAALGSEDDRFLRHSLLIFLLILLILIKSAQTWVSISVCVLIFELILDLECLTRVPNDIWAVLFELYLHDAIYTDSFEVAELGRTYHNFRLDKVEVVLVHAPEPVLHRSTHVVEQVLNLAVPLPR